MTNEIGTIRAVTPLAASAPGAVPKAQEVVPPGRPPPRDEEVREAEKSPADAEPLEEMVTKLNELVQDLHRELRFTVDDASGETVIKVVDSKTDEVVRQIPSEELMRLRQRLQDAAGVIFRDSA